MAKKFDDEFLKDTRDEHRKQSAGAQGSKLNGAAVHTGGAAGAEQGPDKNPGDEKSSGTNGTATGQGQDKAGAGAQDPPPLPPPAPEPVRDEFKEKFDEYFKGVPISGAIVTEFVDDFKCNLLMIYAKKNGLDMSKELFALSPKGKELTSFLVDYAVQNKLFDWIKKYPLASAAAVIGLSAASSLVLIETMKKNKDENQALKKEVEELRRQRQEQNRNNATVVEDLNNLKAGGESVRDFINGL